jgi:hypothetical protein
MEAVKQRDQSTGMPANSLLSSGNFIVNMNVLLSCHWETQNCPPQWGLTAPGACELWCF